LKQSAKWNQLCSCLDVIEDTELAIDAYLQQSEPLTDGDKYLQLYGVLQALFVQQDAVANLAEVLDIRYTHNPAIAEIREIRHDSIGHPTKRGGGKGFNFISRVTIGKSGYQLIKTYPDTKARVFVDVDIQKLIKTQRKILANVLSDMIGKLKDEEMEHRRKFRDKKLKDIFPSTIGYYFEKISGAAHGSELSVLGSMHVKLVKKCLQEFRNALEERGILSEHDGTTYYLELVEYPLTELQKYFDDPGESSLNNRSAYIFAFFVKHHVEKLQQIAKEIDSDYASDI